MKPSPVINVANTAPSNAAKPANGSSSDQSFGQVLAQQVNNPPPSSSSGNGNGNASAQPTPPAAPSSNSTTANSTSNSANDGTSSSTSSTAADGKNVKPKHGQDVGASVASAGIDPAMSGSAQLLALVSNVQQAAANTGASLAAGGATNTIATVAANTAATAQSALANFQAAVSNGATAAKATFQTAAPDFNRELAAVLPQDAQQLTQVATANSDAQGAATPGATSGAQSTSPLDVAPQNSAAPEPAADLAAKAQTDVQVDIAALAQAAAKSADTVRNAVASAAAAPVMVNPTPLNAVANQMSGADDKLTPQVGSPGWDQALGQKVVWMVAGGQQSASLTLNPPDLGPMQVVLSVTNSHATATFTAAQPEVRQALETAMPKLREMLGDAGIQLGQTSVNAGTAQQQQNFAGQASQRSGGGNLGIDAVDGTQTALAQAAAKVTSGIGLVDTFA